MKLMTKFSVAVACIFIAACAPRDTVHHLDIQSALNSPEASGVVNPKVKLYFGTPAPGKVIIANAVTNKKTNAANKSDEKSLSTRLLVCSETITRKSRSLRYHQSGEYRELLQEKYFQKHQPI